MIPTSAGNEIKIIEKSDPNEAQTRPDRVDDETRICVDHGMNFTGSIFMDAVDDNTLNNTISIYNS